MPHLALLGDSILDNARYTGGGPSVVDHVRAILPEGWSASLAAVDGSTTYDIPAQLKKLPPETTHLAMSIGGNNALLRVDLLDVPVQSSGQALLLLYDALEEFEASYLLAVHACLARALPLVTCTIYNGNFDDLSQKQRLKVALAAYNDVIVRVGSEHGLTIVDLRAICNAPVDYANPIEPSSTGGAKIAYALVGAVTGCGAPRSVGRLCTG